MDNPNIRANSQNVNALTAREWAGTLDKIAQGKTNNGHTVVFINKKGDLQEFADKTSAEKAGFKKLKYEEIVKISKTVMDKASNQQDKFEVGRKLNEINVRKNIKVDQKYSGFNPIHQIKGSLKKGEVKEAQKLVKSSGATLATSPARLQNLDSQIDPNKPKHVERSQGGAYGVIFIKSEDKGGEKIVMKFLTNSAPVRLAEHMYVKAGFATANCYFVPRDSEDGRSAKLVEIGKKTKIDVPLSKNPGVPPTTEQARANMIKIREDNLRLSIKAHEDIQIADDVHAISFNDREMVEDQFVEIMSDPAFVKDLGRLAVYDAFVGNSDRMQPWHPKPVNFGNLMVRQTEEGNRLVLIDNEAKVSQEDKGLSPDGLKVIFEGNDRFNVSSYYDVLMAKFPGCKVDKEKFMKAFQEGVNVAAREIVSSYSSDTEIMMWESLSGAGKGAVDIQEMQKNVNYIKQHIK